MIYYPLSTLMMAGIRDILVITNEADLHNFKRTLGDGSQFGVNIQYKIQYIQRGISDAFLIGEDFIAGESVCLILGDNIFYSPMLDSILDSVSEHKDGAIVFGYKVPDPERFGVVEFDENMRVISLEEKPEHPKSNYAVVGIYFYDGKVSDMAKQLKPSDRGELEITDLNKLYLEEGNLNVKLFDDEMKWIDAGTFASLLESSQFIAEKENELGKKILCPEIVAYEKTFITKDQLSSWIKKNKDNDYFKQAGSIQE
jgi:glucose-1-phosphate thymidylyltransferase